MKIPLEFGYSSGEVQRQVSDAEAKQDEPGLTRGQRRRRPGVFYCLILYSRDTALNCQIADYVQAEQPRLDRLFGRRLHGFALEMPADEQRVNHSADAYDLARAFNLGLDELPGVVLGTSLERPKERLGFPVARFLPPDGDRRTDDIEGLFQALAATADRCATRPARTRLKSFHRSLAESRRNVYGDRAPAGSVMRRASDNGEAIAWIKSNGVPVAELVASLASVVVGGGGLA